MSFNGVKWYVRIHVGMNNYYSKKCNICKVFIVLTVNPLEINAVSYNSSTARLASELSGAFLHAACKSALSVTMSNKEMRQVLISTLILTSGPQSSHPMCL